MNALKDALRVEARSRLRSLDDSSRRAGSAAICARIARWPVFARARVVAAYLPLRSEVDLTGLMRSEEGMARQWLVPAIMPGEQEYAWGLYHPGQTLARGPDGAEQPIEVEHAEKATEPDLYLVPGLAFGRAGERLGRGGGHYDRLLARRHSPALGVAFSIQLFDELPVEPHDALMDAVATEKDLIFKQEK